MTLFKITPRFC